MELFQDPSEPLLGSTSSPPEPNEEETQRLDSSCSQDGDLPGCGQLERRWLLWHDFMKEHAHLDAWLQLAEQAVSCPDLGHVTYVVAKEELRRFERLRCEAGSQLVQLDGLAHRNRTLSRLFQGPMQTRLLALARACGRRWDETSAKLESITGQLQLFVSEWERFEAEREELALWLADLDVRLTQVDHLTGNTCEKLRRLQDFQQCVFVNSGRVNALLRRGEALIQRSQPSDARRVEEQLLELLQRCSLVDDDIARTHTRLLSMRLVFEDDCILSQAPDSGCPSESLLEDEGALDKANLVLPASSKHPKDSPSVTPSPVHFPSSRPSPPSPTHEHLEWDPSVDIGRSVSQDDADSSYFSAGTSVCHRDGQKRWSYLSSLSDISNGEQEADWRLTGGLDHAHPNIFSPIETQWEGTSLSGHQWATSTPDRRDGEPVSFDGGRVRAWLGVQGPAPPERTTACSKAVQTEGEEKCHLEGSHINSQRLHDTQQPLPGPSPSPSHDPQASPDWMKRQRPSGLQAEEEEESRCVEAECPLSQQRRAPSSLLSTVLLYLLLAAALALLACLIWVALEPPCNRSGKMPSGFHLTLRYVNGPPPT